jgi:hypothetical protein
MIKETGYWTSDDTDAIHVHEPNLAEWILNYLQNDKDKQLIDFGCGMGDYLKKLHENGFSNLHGFEGEIREGSPKFVKSWDLSTTIKNNKQYDSLKKELGKRTEINKYIQMTHAQKITDEDQSAFLTKALNREKDKVDVATRLSELGGGTSSWMPIVLDVIIGVLGLYLAYTVFNKVRSRFSVS